METAIQHLVTTENPKIQTEKFGVYTITKDFEKLTVLITRPSTRSRLGIKYVHHYSYRNYEFSKAIFKMNDFVDKFIELELKRESVKLQKKMALKNARKDFKCPYEVGQILYNSWGYDQTNINFYQIVEIKGKSVTVRELNQTRTYSQMDAGTCMPVKDSFAGEPIKKVIQIRIYDDKVNYNLKDLSNWDGRAKYWSSYH